jgi:hypothetical protein
MESHHPNVALTTIYSLLDTSSTAESRFPPTLLYNEGWLLRLVLSAAEHGVPCLPFNFHSGARWFSEALLASAFLPRYRGDRLAEAYTHADGVVGHFRFAPESKAGLALDPAGSQFAVLEAKVFSTLSKGTKRAPDFDQAARNVACMAETIRMAGAPVEAWDCLAFCVLAPSQQIDAGVFAPLLTKESIQAKILSRIADYENDRRVELEAWYYNWASKMLDRIQIHCLSWESIIDSISIHDPALGYGISEFYSLTLQFNGQPKAGPQDSLVTNRSEIVRA